MSITIKKAINDFLLTCKVEGKSSGTIECYTDKLKRFLWYTKRKICLMILVQYMFGKFDNFQHMPAMSPIDGEQLEMDSMI